MKQARLAAGWLKQKRLALIALSILVVVPSIFVLFTPPVLAAADAYWTDNYKTLVYQHDEYSNPTTNDKGQTVLTNSQFGSGLGDCQAVIVFANKNLQQATSAKYTPTTEVAGTCTPLGPGQAISVNKTANNTAAAAAAGDSSASGEDSSDNAAQNGDLNDPCDASSNALSWFVCPVVGLFNEAVIRMQRIIDHLMVVNVNDVFNYSQSPGKNYYSAWNSFRLFGVIFIIVAGLIMVISQALGMEIFDAYTVKKVLPRLFVAAIGISLSWWLLKFLAEITNDLGIAIRSVIYYPFRNIGSSGLQNTGSLLLTTIFSVGTFWVLGIGGVLSLIVTAALAALVAFLVLIIRQLVLIFLIILAPIAIACYVLPNTEKVYKLWWDSISKGMLMFPIISGFIALGHVFSAVAANTSSGAGSSINQIIALIAFFLPYFALPFTFRLAGGAIGTIAGMTNDRSRGAFDRLKKFRGNQTAQNLHAMKEGTRFRNNNALGRGFNRVSHGIAMAPAGGLNPMQARSRYNAAKGEHVFDQAEEIRTKNADFLLGAQDDRLLRAAAAANGRSDIRRMLQAEGIRGAELDTSTGIVERMQSSGSREAVKAAAAMQRFATGTGFNRKWTDANGVDHVEFDYQAAMDTIRDASDGDRALAGRLLGQAKGVSTQAGQLGFGGASYGTLSGGLDESFAGKAVDGDKIALDAFESNDAVTVARAREPHVRAMTRAASRRLNELNSGAPVRNGESGELGRLTAQVEAFRDTSSMYAAPSRARIINDEAHGSQPARQDVHGEVSSHRQNPESQVFDPVTRQPVAPPSPDVEQYLRNRSTRGGDPNDPRLPEA